MPAFELEEPSFRQIETGSDGQLMVLGEYTLYPSEQAEVDLHRKAAGHLLLPAGKCGLPAVPYARFQ